MVKKKQKYLVYLPTTGGKIIPTFTPYARPNSSKERIKNLGKFYLYWHFLGRLASKKRAGLSIQNYLADPAGINQTRGSLHSLMVEAYYLRRIPVLMPIILPDIHNLDCHVEEKCITGYFNLSESFLRVGEEKMPLEWALPENLWRAKDRIQSMKLVDRYEIIPESTNNNYDLIVREKIKGFKMAPGLYRDPEVVKIYYNSSLELQPRKYLLDAAKKITSKLGKFHFFFCRVPWDSHTVNYKENIHKYMIQRSWDSYTTFEHFITSEGLSRQLMKIFPKGSKLYIASNLWPPKDKDLFDPLKKYYDVYRYYDFSELIHFADPTKKAGNNTIKLQLIEEIVQKKSAGVFGIHYMDMWRKDNSLKKLVGMPDSPDWIEDPI